MISISRRRNVEITRKVSKLITRKFWSLQGDNIMLYFTRQSYPSKQPIPDERIVHKLILNLKTSKVNIVSVYRRFSRSRECSERCLLTVEPSEPAGLCKHQTLLSMTGSGICKMETHNWNRNSYFLLLSLRYVR